MSKNAESSSLKGNLSVTDVVLITASGVTPASSIFVIAPLAIVSAGSGAFISFLIAGFIAITIALCYAELGAAHPSAGGEYTVIRRLMGVLGGVQTYLFILAVGLFVPAVLATGAVPYLNTALGVNWNSSWVAMMTVVIASSFNILNIKFGALVTGFFLIVEILILFLIAFLGFSHPKNDVTIFIDPIMVGTSGGLESVPFSAMAAVIGIALFSYNGYGGAIYLAEDMKEKGRPMAKAILLTLFIVIFVELLPFAALLIGAPSFAEMAKQADHVGYLITQLGGPTLAKVVSMAIYLSVFNAIIALVAQSSRLVFSSGRDQFWLSSINRALTKIHPKFGTPWIATIIFCIPSALLALCSDLASLTSFSVILLLLVYSIMGVAALFSRRGTYHHPYLMPFWPLPVLIALIGCGYLLVTTLEKSSVYDFFIIVGIIVLGFVLSFFQRKNHANLNTLLSVEV